MKYLWLIFVGCVGLPVLYLSIVGVRFEAFTFTALHEDRHFDVSFELPLFNHWKPVVVEQDLGMIEIDYVLQEGKVGYSQDDVAATVVVRKADRTAPLSVTEKSKMIRLKKGNLLFSEPKENDEENRATVLIQINTLPGFYVLEGPISMLAPCNLKDTHTIAVAVLDTLSPAKNYRNKANLELTLRSKLLGSKVDWPSQVWTCF